VDAAKSCTHQPLSAFAGQRDAELAADSREPVAPIEPLTDRETEVLGLVAVALTNCEIGERLLITEGTAKAHTSNIHEKLDARSRTEAVARARDLGIL
jgi:ATP/maltotriose-dependent transcriptional regulator MalT